MTFAQQQIASLLKLAMSNPNTSQTDYGRALYLTAKIFADNGLLIRAEGLLNNASENLAECFGYEKVELLYVQANTLNKIEARKKEAREKLERAKIEARALPVWFPYLVNLIVPEFKAN